MADLELVKEGVNWYLRFFIEHLSLDAPISTDDCEAASERLSDWLDENDPIPQAYFLEVSSPGIERPLKKEKDFIRFQGHVVQVHTYKPVHGAKTHRGSLGETTENTLSLQKTDGEITIDRDMIAGIHLFWEDCEEE